MKKIGKIALATAMSALTISGNINESVTIVQSGTALESKNKDKQSPPKLQEPQQSIVINNYGGLDFNPVNYGRSPKEYGMWLQSIGKQKWNTKRRVV